MTIHLTIADPDDCRQSFARVHVEPETLAPLVDAIAALTQAERIKLIGAAVFACQRLRFSDAEFERHSPVWQRLALLLKPPLPSLAPAARDARKRFALWVQLQVMAFDNTHHDTLARYIVGTATTAESAVLLHHAAEAVTVPADIGLLLEAIRARGPSGEHRLQRSVSHWREALARGEGEVDEGLRRLVIGATFVNPIPAEAVLH